MWNDLYPENPVHDICEYGKKDSKVLQELPNLVSILTTSAEILTEDHPIWEEILIFKNIQAKYKRILHCDKSLQLLQRVGGCVRKMVLLNLSKAYLDLAEKILAEVQNPNRESSYYLPSCQQLEYVLIRTQTAAKLICEALHYSRETFCYLIQRLKVGHIVLNLMMATSVTARLNLVFRGLLLQVCDTYKKIYWWRNKLKRGGWEWPVRLELPADLETWINLEESEHLKPKHLPKEQLDFLTSMFEESGENPCGPNPEDNDIIPLDDEESLTNSELNVQKECIVIDDDNVLTNDDNGVPVARSGKLKINESKAKSKTEEQSQQFTKAQKLLLKKIRAAEDMKGLKVIWDNLDVTSQELLPNILTPNKIRLIDKVFLQLKRRMSQLNQRVLSAEEKEGDAKFLIKVAGLKFAKHLGILPTKKGNIVQKKTFVLKPVRTFKQLGELYEIIYQKLQAAQYYQKCAKLKKRFKSRKADIKLLVENDEKEAAKELIYNTSKFFIDKYTS